MRVTEEKIKQWINEGRGQGHGAEYIPWIKIVRGGSPTWGNLQYRYVPQLDRYFHLLSRNELHIVRLLLWLQVADLRDQFPCWPWPHPHPLYQNPSFHPVSMTWSEGTLMCAQGAGIKHPLFPGTKIFHIPTVDLMATVKTVGSVRAVAFDIKFTKVKAALDDHSLEKLAIKREYCLQLGIPWKLVSSSDIPSTLASNLFILIHYSGELEQSLVGIWEHFLEVLSRHLSPDLSINDTLKIVEFATKLKFDQVLQLFYRALWFRKTSIDLREALVMNSPPMLSDQAWVQSTSDYMLGDDHG